MARGKRMVADVWTTSTTLILSSFSPVAEDRRERQNDRVGERGSGRREERKKETEQEREKDV